ncbi:MAG: DUF2330 domain-containing protein [Deltaproteobacteria bacterium]|nr:MAG: DUF2330 domain-containing protein [Deltaproteobacteria bacterium]
MLPLLLSLSSTAWPCAAIFTEDGGSASSDAQEVILEQGDGYVDVSYRVEAGSNVDRVGWIIPVFGEFIELVDADRARFDALRELTAPQVWISSLDGYEDDMMVGCGCAGASKADALQRGGDTGAVDGDSTVQIVAQGFTGTYEYTVISGSDEQDVLDWLDAAGFSVGPSGPAIASYVAEGGVSFAALTVAGVASDETRAELPGVRIRVSGDSLRFPSQMARYGMPEEVSTRIFVIGDQRATVGGGWVSTEFGYRDVDGDPARVDELYADLLRDIVGDGRAYVEIWSDSYQGRWLTRFDTIARREAHTTDVTFSLDGGTRRTAAELEIWTGASAAALWLLPGLFGLTVAGVRRRG